MSSPKGFEKISLPVVAAPMFLVSNEEIITESSKKGVVGTMPALNLRSTEAFSESLDKIEAGRNKEIPYGINLIVHPTNPRLQADLEVCVAKKVPLVITSLGAVKDVVGAVQSYGGLVFHDVTNLKHAKKAMEAGVDGLILVAGGAGGHAGTTNPFALVGEIRKHFNGTILLAGCISHGRDVLGALAMGADLAYMGTRFIATEESAAQPEYKKMVVDAQAKDIVHTAVVSGVPASFMRQSLESNGFDLSEGAVKGKVDFGDKLTLDNEAKAWKNVWSAGHGVSAINDIPKVGELIDRLQTEYTEARSELQGKW